MNKRGFLACLGATLLVSSAAAPVFAADWPARPIKVLVPFPAGGLSDSIVRIIAEKAGQTLGQAVIVDNRPGASGKVMYQELHRAAPDGYTLGYISTTAPVVSLTSTDLSYDVVKDFEGIVLIGVFGGFLTISNNVPVKSAQEFVQYVQKNSDKLAYGSFGIGAPNHLQTERLLDQLQTKMNHIPYGGDAPVQQALARDEIQLGILATYPQAFVDAGKVRVLGTTLAQRSPLYPDLPTVKEGGMGAAEYSAWAGITAPKGVPQEVREKLTQAFVQAIRDPKITEMLEQRGYIVRAEPPAAVAAAIANDIEYYSAALRTSGIDLKDLPQK